MNQYGLVAYNAEQYGKTFFFDTEAPYLSNQDPAPNSSDVNEASIVRFRLLDDWAGVDVNSTRIYIDSLLVYDGSTFLPPYDLGSTITQIPRGYEFSISKNSLWPSWHIVTVRVVGQDIFGNTGDQSYQFRIRDYLGPLVTPIYPTLGQVFVSVDTNVTVSITDEQLLQDHTIRVEIDQGHGWEMAYEEDGTPEFKPGWDGPGSQVEPVSGGVVITIDPMLPFPSATTIYVRVTALDSAGNEARLA